jgi:hypothetical protein
LTLGVWIDRENIWHAHAEFNVQKPVILLLFGRAQGCALLAENPGGYLNQSCKHHKTYL